MFVLTEAQIAVIKKIYLDRWNTELTAVSTGVENVFGGNLAIASYKIGDQIISDVVYMDINNSPKAFETTLELLLFLRDKNKLRIVGAIFETKLFPGLIFLGLLISMCWLGTQTGGGLSEKVLTIFGSVVGLAAAMFFRKQDN